MKSEDAEVINHLLSKALGVLFELRGEVQACDAKYVSTAVEKAIRLLDDAIIVDWGEEE